MISLLHPCLLLITPYASPAERLTERCQALHPTAGTPDAQSPEVGPTATDHL